MMAGHGGGGEFMPGTAGTPTSWVELTVSCRNLLDKDVFSKSDPMCVVYHRPFGEMQWKELKRTECIKNTLNPDFATKVNMAYHFEEQQRLRFELYDVDSESADLSTHDFLGQAECTLGQIVTSGVLKLQLRAPEGVAGMLVVTCEELSSVKDEVELQFVGRGLDKKDFFGKSDPFLSFLKTNESGQYTVVHRTEVIKHTLNPSWKKFTIPVRSLCNGDYDRNVKVECYDWNRNGSHSFIGEFYVTLRKLSEGPGPHNVFQCINPEKQKRKKQHYKHSGEIHLIHFKIQQAFSFLDYIRGGTQLNCTIAIDFTASNGNPLSAESLHYIHPSTPNPYEQALRAVGEIIEDYDTDKLFPVLGFGARLPPDGRVSHEFFVNMHPSSPYCERIDGVLEAYRSCIQRIQLYGPTNFAPIINHVSRIAQTKQDGSEYYILLIITDGIITDMPQTKEAIVNASVLPVSIIIVGVGNADFSAMEELDGDTVPVSFHGRKVARDIVQFVPFQNFVQFMDYNVVRLRLAKEVLAEIPDQFLSYMKSKGIAPRAPVYEAQQLPPDPEKVVI